MVEDFDCDEIPVLAAPSQAAAEMFTAVHGVFLELLRDRGADPAWGRSLPGALRDHGLCQVSSSTYAVDWLGGSPGIDPHRVNAGQLADRLRESGVDDRTMAACLALLGDPAFAVRSYPLISATGRKAGTERQFAGTRWERLTTPDELRAVVPMPPASFTTTDNARTAARQILNGEDDRLLVIGPAGRA